MAPRCYDTGRTVQCSKLLTFEILLNNFPSDVPSIAISSDNVDPDRVSQPQRWNIKDIQRFMVVFGLISSVFDLTTFAVLLLVFHADQATFQTSWFVVSLLTVVGAYWMSSIRRLR